MLLLLAGLAHALTCGEIQQMVNVNVPVAIVVQTIQGVDGVEMGTDACLAKAGMPAEVVAAARDANQRLPPPQLPPAPPDIAAARDAAHRGDWAEVHRNAAQDTTIEGLYLDAVALVQLGKHRSAVAAFVAVIQAVDSHAGRRVTLARAAQLDRDRDLAVLGIARVYYAIERYPDAARWDDRVAKRSPLWPQAQFEAAWADFIRGNLNGARSRLQHIRKAKAWMPGLPWLEYLVVDALDWQEVLDQHQGCPFDKHPDLIEDGAREAAVARLKAELEPAREALAAVVAGRSSADRLPPVLRRDSERLLREVEDALEGMRAQEAERRYTFFSGGSMDRCF